MEWGSLRRLPPGRAGVTCILQVNDSIAWSVVKCKWPTGVNVTASRKQVRSGVAGDRALAPAGAETTALRSPCPVACTLDIIGDRWTLLLIRDLLAGKKRYGEFLASPERIPTNILAERLKRLE